MQGGGHPRRALRAGANVLTLSLTLLTGCALPPATAPEQAEYERVDAALRATDRFGAFTRACRAAGGVVFVNGSWGRKPLQPMDLDAATCARAPGRLLR